MHLKKFVINFAKVPKFNKFNLFSVNKNSFYFCNLTNKPIQNNDQIFIDNHTKRKLASVQIIKEIETLIWAKDYAVAKILGWEVIVKKDDYKVGNKVVYFEIDSLLPEENWTEFLKLSNFRVKTITSKAIVSQGLILPLNIVKKERIADPHISDIIDLEVGYDLTNILKIIKYELEPIDNISEAESKSKETKKVTSKAANKPFPTEFIEKSDEVRIQAIPELINIFLNIPYFATLKYDGTSATYLINPITREFIIASRHVQKGGDIWKHIALTYKIQEKLLSLNGRYAIQGEICGPKYNDNPLGFKENQFFIFTIKDMIENRYLDMD